MAVPGYVFFSMFILSVGIVKYNGIKLELHCSS